MNILISMPPQQAEKAVSWADALQQRLPDATLIIDKGGLVEHSVDYLVTWQPRPDLLSQLTGARALFTASAGVDALLQGTSLPQCPVIRLRDAGMGAQMADYALYACLHYFRGFDRMRLCQSESHWHPAAGTPAHTPRVGILGLGTLGSVAATALVNQGFAVSGWSRRVRDVDGVKSYAGVDSLTAFLASTDILICLLPLTTETHHLLNAERLASLPRHAVVVNLARGDIIVESDLLEALDSGHLRGAMLDVFSTEPLPESHAFWQHPRVVITPHVAAETLVEPAADQIASEISRIESGQPPLGQVDRTAGY